MHDFMAWRQLIVAKRQILAVSGLALLKASPLRYRAARDSIIGGLAQTAGPARGDGPAVVFSSPSQPVMPTNPGSRS